MKMNALIDTLKRILNRVVNSPITPVVPLLLFLPLEEYIQRDGETWLRVVEMLLGFLGLIAVIRCYQHKWVRRISLGLLALVMLFNINRIRQDCEPSPAKTVNVSTAKSRSSAVTKKRAASWMTWVLAPRLASIVSEPAIATSAAGPDTRTAVAA